MAKTNRPLLFVNNCTCLTVQMHADLIVRGNGHVSRCADVNAHGVRGNDDVLRCADVNAHVVRGDDDVLRCADVNAHAVRGNDDVLRCADVKVHAVRAGVIVKDGGLRQLSGAQSGSHSPGLLPRCGQEEVRSAPT